MAGARAGAIDEPRKFGPSGPGSSPVFAGGRHIGYVYKSGRGWWAEYGGERRHPAPFKTKRAAVEAVERNQAARTVSRTSKGTAPAPAKPAAPPAPPTVGDRYHAERARRSLRTEARTRQGEFERELDNRVGGLGERLKAPPRLQQRAKRFGGGHVQKATKENYDWFYELSQAEQARIRSNWMTESSTAAAPSEIEERISMTDWLRLTRAIDMSKAIQTGRHVQADRYGGQSPASLIAGEPYDLEEIHHRDGRRRAAHWKAAKQAGKFGHGHPVNPKNVRRGIAYRADGSLDVQYFTDEQGRIHPIRASYETGVPELARPVEGDDDPWF
jgi:hypothetical protein